ncbi:MAG: nucleotide exchange factor GrpE, partial [Alistipes ihumii]
EKKGLIALGGEDVIKSLLGVMDDIDRALVAMSQTDDIESVRKGIELIHQKLLDTLHAKGVQEIEAIGSELDTDLHEAVAKLPVEDDKKGKIIDVVQKGYKLKDKVVRYAKVVVGE